jgi:hypothetical protein
MIVKHTAEPCNHLVLCFADALGVRGVHDPLPMKFFVKCNCSLRSREPIGITGCGPQLDFSPRSETSIFNHREAEIHLAPFVRIIATKAANKSPCVGFRSKSLETFTVDDRRPAIAVLYDFRILVGSLHLAAVYLRKAILTARAEGQQATPVAQKKGHQARINLVA